MTTVIAISDADVDRVAAYMQARTGADETPYPVVLSATQLWMEKIVEAILEDGAWLASHFQSSFIDCLNREELKAKRVTP